MGKIIFLWKDGNVDKYKVGDDMMNRLWDRLNDMIAMDCLEVEE